MGFFSASKYFGFLTHIVAVEKLNILITSMFTTFKKRILILSSRAIRKTNLDMEW